MIMGHTNPQFQLFLLVKSKVTPSSLWSGLQCCWLIPFSSLSWLLFHHLQPLHFFPSQKKKDAFRNTEAWSNNSGWGWISHSPSKAVHYGRKQPEPLRLALQRIIQALLARAWMLVPSSSNRSDLLRGNTSSTGLSSFFWPDSMNKIYW